MEWTKEPPTKPGWYWYLPYWYLPPGETEFPPEIDIVQISSSFDVWEMFYDESRELAMYPDGYWAGPIDPPALPTKAL